MDKKHRLADSARLHTDSTFSTFNTENQSRILVKYTGQYFNSPFQNDESLQVGP